MGLRLGQRCCKLLLVHRRLCDWREGKTAHPATQAAARKT
jgi:hypothetical protein